MGKKWGDTESGSFEVFFLVPHWMPASESSHWVLPLLGDTPKRKPKDKLLVGGPIGVNLN